MSYPNNTLYKDQSFVLISEGDKPFYWTHPFWFRKKMELRAMRRHLHLENLKFDYNLFYFKIPLIDNNFEMFTSDDYDSESDYAEDSDEE